jgi:hypothetical protein
MNMKKQTINTVWEIRTYDVWGNSKDGYDVNDTYIVDRDYPLALDVTINNKGTAQEFLSASPTDRQIRKALDLRSIQIDLEGDDLTIYVNRSSNGYPLGELHCVSHESLSPIRIKA